MKTFNDKPKRVGVNYIVGYSFNQDLEIVEEFECPKSMIGSYYNGKYIMASRDDLVTHFDNGFNWHISNFEYRLKQQHTDEEIFLIKEDLRKLIKKRERIFSIIYGKCS